MIIRIVIIMTPHVTVNMEVANQQPPRPVHISRYGPISGPILHYMDWTSTTSATKKEEKIWCWPSHARNKCVIVIFMILDCDNLYTLNVNDS